MKIINKRIGIFIVPLAVAFLVIAIRSNPTDTAQKFEIMRHDMDAILASGGSVITSAHNSKYGSAYLYVGIDASTWTPMLADKYDDHLLALGWKKTNIEGDGLLCKDGINARVNRNMERNEGKSVYGIVMTYNALTIRKCDN